MRRTVALTGMTLVVAFGRAQTFVPRFRPAPTGQSGYSTLLGEKNDLEISIGRVAEAPKLELKGISASAASSQDSAEPTAPFPSAAVVAIFSSVAVVLVLAGLAVRRARAEVRPTRPQSGR